LTTQISDLEGGFFVGFSEISILILLFASAVGRPCIFSGSLSPMTQPLMTLTWKVGSLLIFFGILLTFDVGL
jgi:hypothetical protein